MLPYSRQLPMGLIVALDDDASSSGELFWDNGVAKGAASDMWKLGSSIIIKVFTDCNRCSTLLSYQ